MSSGQHQDAADILQQLGALLGDDPLAASAPHPPPGLCSTSYDIIRLDLRHSALAQDRQPATSAPGGTLSTSTREAIDSLSQGAASCADMQSLKHRVHTHLHSTHSHHALPIARDKQAVFQQALAAAAAASSSQLQQRQQELADWSSELTDAPTSWNTSLYSTIELECQLQAQLKLLQELRTASQQRPATTTSSVGS